MESELAVSQAACDRAQASGAASPSELRRYYDDDFGFRARLEASYAVVRAEWERLPPGALRVWPEKSAFEGRWATFGLVGAGRRVDGNCQLCPRTAALVETIPGLYSAGFSVLDARSWLPRHRGLDAGVLRCHLGIVIPEDSAFMVDAETRRWAEGKTLVFDDTIEHESWNKSSRPKVLLLVDFEKPWLERADREARAAHQIRDQGYYRSLFPEWV